MLKLHVVSEPENVSMETKQRRGIQSIELGSKLLEALARHVTPLALGDVAKAAGMTAGKAHPYMVSFANVGFVTQEAGSGKYELGPLALQLGLAKLRQLNPVREATESIAELSTATGQSVAIAVWGNMGPTVVQMAEPVQSLHVNVRAGTVMSLTETATGRLFAAYLLPKVVDTLVKNLPAGIQGSNKQFSRKEFETQLAEIREHGMARAIGKPNPGILAFSAPVFDSTGQIVLAITLMGAIGSMDDSWDGGAASELRNCAAKISKKLGFNGDVTN